MLLEFQRRFPDDRVYRTSDYPPPTSSSPGRTTFSPASSAGCTASNRRKNPTRRFYSLLGIAITTKHSTYKMPIRAEAKAQPPRHCQH
jgi:hypothetical protein